MTKKKPESKELKVEYVDIDSILPYINNAKLHPPEQVAQIAASIREFGFTQPILIDETNTILAGHGRLMASQKLKLKQVPVLRLDYMSEAQKKAYILADNKLTMNSGFNNELLKLEFDTLKEMDFDLNLTGFTSDEISDLGLNLAMGEDFQPNLPSENNDITDAPKYKLIISLDSEEEQQDLFNELKSQGYKVKAG